MTKKSKQIEEHLLRCNISYNLTIKCCGNKLKRLKVANDTEKLLEQF